MNSTELFITTAIEAGVSEAVAEKALAKFLSVGLVSFDPCNGSINVLTGDVYLKVNLEHAASI